MARKTLAERVKLSPFEQYSPSKINRFYKELKESGNATAAAKKVGIDKMHGCYFARNTKRGQQAKADRTNRFFSAVLECGFVEQAALEMGLNIDTVYSWIAADKEMKHRVHLLEKRHGKYNPNEPMHTPLIVMPNQTEDGFDVAEYMQIWGCKDIKTSGAYTSALLPFGWEIRVLYGINRAVLYHKLGRRIAAWYALDYTKPAEVFPWD